MSQLRGIHHIGILVRDLEAAKNTYRDQLGFRTEAPGEGKVQASGVKISNITFEDGSYLEFLAVNDPAKVRVNRESYLPFLAKREGAKFAALLIASAPPVISFLRGRGLEVDDPNALAPGTKNAPVRSYATVGFNVPEVPPHTLFFFQPGSMATHADRIRQSNLDGTTRHANTARRIASIWVVVRDINAAAKALAVAGLQADEPRAFAELGAMSREIDVGGAYVTLLSPVGNAGTTASFLADHGEGIMGVRIEVASLETARALMNGSRAEQETYAGAHGERSILLPPDLTHGLWIEVFEKAP